MLAMIITTKYKLNNFTLQEIKNIDNDKIEIIDNVKYLGFQLDNCLIFNNNLEHIIKKILKIILFLAHLSLFVRSVKMTV